MDRLTNSSHFLPIRINHPVEMLVEMYVEEIVILHGVTSIIVQNRDLRFTSRFWKFLQNALGSKLELSFAYHPHTNGHTERTIPSLEDLLRAL